MTGKESLTMYVVAADGTGDFTSLQSAVDAAPPGSGEPAVLLVRDGVYNGKVVINKDNLRVIGESRAGTIITGSGHAKQLDECGNERGTFLSYTMLVTGTGVEVENLTVRNDAGDGRIVGQAIAVFAAGDRGVWRNCTIAAHQDTLFCGPTMPKVQKDALPREMPPGVPSAADCPPVPGRQYFEDCAIQGDVDFIFGPYRCWFERCILVMNARGGYYTAANTPMESPHGFVFHDCVLTGYCGDGEAFLGRPWRPYARTVFLNCHMDARVSPRGFADWDAARPVTHRLGEYGTRGARADLSARHPAQKRLTREEAEMITPRAVLGYPNGWHPWARDSARQ